MRLDLSTIFWPLLLLLGLMLALGLTRLGKSAAQFQRKRFLTDAEARVLGFLELALPNHRIMAQVSMGALLKAGESQRAAAQATRNRFAQKIVDFAVVTRETAEVVALIELDDRTHRSAQDARRDAMTAAAGYRTIRLAGQPRPTAASVRAAVAELGLLATGRPAAEAHVARPTAR